MEKKNPHVFDQKTRAVEEKLDSNIESNKSNGKKRGDGMHGKLILEQPCVFECLGFWDLK